MGIKIVGGGFNHGNCYIGAMGADPLKVRQDIIKGKALFHFAFSGTETGDMAALQLVAEDADEFPQGLNFYCGFQIILTESVDG